MWTESAEKNRPLRTGLTTGCCATACCVAAAYYLLTKKTKTQVCVTLPKGQVVDLTIEQLQAHNDQVLASTIKDAGDDPDVTHGASVFVLLSLTQDNQITFSAGKGVGTVTRTGLLLAVGEPAINPVPRQMMQQHLLAIAQELHYQGGFKVEIGVKNGQQLALKTMNPRLGIVNGLSILGTTGIVRPFSCSAYIASIHQGIDVATANHYQHIAATTGSTSETFIQQHYDLPEIALIEMGDFVGAVLKYLKKVPVKKLSLCGGFGKISKLANAQLDLHSKKSSINFEQFSYLAEQAGASKAILEAILQANTSMAVLNICQQADIDMANLICQQALDFALSQVPSGIEIEVWAVNRTGELVGKALSTSPYS